MIMIKVITIRSNNVTIHILMLAETCIVLVLLMLYIYVVLLCPFDTNLVHLYQQVFNPCMVALQRNFLQFDIVRTFR